MCIVSCTHSLVFCHTNNYRKRPIVVDSLLVQTYVIICEDNFQAGPYSLYTLVRLGETLLETL